MGFATDAIHAGQDPDPTTGAIMTPIYQTSTYVQEALGKSKGYDYARTINPTRLALEKNLAALEGGEKGFCFASGMSAIAAVMTLVGKGDHVVVSSMTYGGTYRLFERILRGYGLDFTYVDTGDLEATERSIRPDTRMLYIETPTNPLMSLTDLEPAAKLARRRSLISVVDNTFMSPYFQKPLAFGIDVVLHSTTKFINGHSDSVGGCVVTSNRDHAERIGFTQNSVGAILSPFDSWLVLRGIKTLHLRMRSHDAGGRQVAAFLDSHPKVRRVLYPGLPSHPQHELARTQCSGFGGMISFDLGDFDRAKRFLDRLRLCALAESLGGVETLICHPGTMTHASIPEAERERQGFTSGLIRISVGNEDVEDIVADLEQGLAAV
ncbi:MAG TPA: PLP-dependent aspartate aminotransferase family protein [Candidatus Polarisedimenticolia bacterium]|jgi:cystathionine beta-lyase/cystathionine gamma-synthase|nr:PLP-dependent aspartate aminotransferase family protein [Candidatus Polarisedimenticolia bacterium]